MIALGTGRGTKAVVFAVLVTSLLTACTRVGPTSIKRDRFNHVSMISDSWKEQMLLNLVKLRDADAPVLLDVASVISQYELTGVVSAGFAWDIPMG